jgi:hypothetical protein
MKARTALVAAVFTLCGALAVVAQSTPTILAALEYQKPKNGMVKQYEDGRKQKVAWHKQQNDSQALYVWETLTGDSMGTYIIGRLNQHWADFDKPSVPDQADIDEYNKVIGNYVESLTSRYYALMPKVSNMGGSTPTDKFAEIITFRVKYGKDADFESAIARVNDAAQKTKWPVAYIWYTLAFGGNTGDYVLVLPHKSWAEFEGKPDTKPFRDMLKEGLGQAGADSIINQINSSVASQTAEIIQFRPDLSYLPAK